MSKVIYLPYPIFERPPGTEDITNEEIAFRTMRVYGVPVFDSVEAAEEAMRDDEGGKEPREHNFIRVTLEDEANKETVQ